MEKHPAFQGNQSWLAKAGRGHPNSLGCGGRQDPQPQGGSGAGCQGFQEVEGAAGLERDIELACCGGRCDDVGCDGCVKYCFQSFFKFQMGR